MNIKEQIEEILLTDFGSFDEYTVEKLLNLHIVMPRYLVANSTPTINNKTCLTIGKKYEILHEHDDGMVCVVDDYGEMEIMVKSFFNEA